MQTIRQGIRTDTEVELLLTEGDKLVGDVSKCYELLRKASVRLSEFKENGIRIAKERVDEIEGEAAFDVLQAVDDDNKLMYKNEGQRKPALVKKLVANSNWRAANKTLREAEQTERVISQEILKCEHDIKISRYYLSVWQSRMVVIAGLSNEQQEHRHHFTAGLNVTIGGNNGEEKN